MSSGLPQKADIAQYSRHVSKVPLAFAPREISAPFSKNRGGTLDRSTQYRWLGMLIGDTNLSLVAVSSPRSNQLSAHVVARFHPLAQPPEVIRASRTRKSSRWRLAPQTDCDSFSGPSSLKKAAKHVAYFASPLSSDANGATLRVEGSLTTIIS